MFFINPRLMAIMLALPSAAIADQWASIAATPGVGQIEIVSNYMLFSSAKSYDVKIPTAIRSGTKIQIRYRKGSEVVVTNFASLAIS